MELTPVSKEMIAKIEQAKDRAKQEGMIPPGRVQSFEIKDGHITRDGVPFFYVHWNTWSPLANDFSIEGAKILSYYTLFNTFHSAHGSQAAKVKPGEIPETFLADVNTAYDLGVLVAVRGGSHMLPFDEEYAREHPEELARNHKGQPYTRRMRGAMPREKDKPVEETNQIGYVPRIGSKYHLERIRDCHVSLALWCRNHPGVLGPFVWEEMYYPRGGFADLEIAMYQEWLKEKFHSIDELNDKWGTNHTDFTEIIPPTAELENESNPLYGLRHAPDVFYLAKSEEKLEVSGNGLCFQLFKLQDLTRRKALIYDTYKAFDSKHPVIGSKAARGPQMWIRHQYVDVSGECEILAPMVKPGIEKHGRVWQPALVNLCQYWYYPSTGWPHYPFYRGPWQRYNSWEEDLYSIQSAPYAKIIREIFNGAKSLFVEDYTNMNEPHGGTEYHYIHHRRAYEQLRLVDDCRGWGELPTEYTQEVNDLPDVYVEDKTIHLARAYQAAYRLGPLFLPTKNYPARVGILMSLESRYAPTAKWNFWEVVPALVDLLERIHVACEVVTNYCQDDISVEKYDLLIVGTPAMLCDKNLAEKIKTYLNNGGKVFYTAGGFSRELDSLQMGTGTLPMYGLSDVFGVEWDLQTEPNAEKNILLQNDPDFASLIDCELPCYSWPPKFSVGAIPWIGTLPPARNPHTGILKPLKDSKVIGTIDDLPAVVINKERNVISALVPQLQIIDRLAHPWEENWRAFMKAIVKWAGVNLPVQVEDTLNAHLIDPGILVGDNYWLLGIANYAKEEVSFTLKVGFLPTGNYDIMDVTGERPITYRDSQGNNHPAPDPMGRQTKFVAKDISTKDLADKGLSLQILPKSAVILMIRPAGERVWVDMPLTTLKAQLLRTGLVVVGDKAASQEISAALSIIDALGKKGINARLLTSSEIDIINTEYDVVAEGHILESFRNKPIKCPQDLILIGSAATNELIAHIEKAGVFAYDKVLQKVTSDYPGPGRGIVQLVEAVNTAVYDATDRCRRALVVGGGDIEGTINAIDTLLQYL